MLVLDELILTRALADAPEKVRCVYEAIIRELSAERYDPLLDVTSARASPFMLTLEER